MEARFYREQEIARLPDFLPSATYNLAHTLLSRTDGCLFVPIRSLQYMAVLDAEEFIFVDGQNRAWVELAWQNSVRGRAARSTNGCRSKWRITQRRPRKP
ncbi:MAG: hypothetical protein QG662_37 [Pseudomonadota bacterium]|nr:hypothetical protein [Pseudomonadota bacterium]